ncbi:MAG: efflux RND transporter periplasmic adaptor subunit [Clostridia bacterium]|nr:efflux RND transporter periplasmic adaptor subunit [Clostridia bacterium]
MKKYIILSFITLTIILTIFAVGYSKINETEYFRAVKAEKTTAVETLRYNGTVEYANSAVTASNGMGIVQSVLVSSGDFVEKGDPVMTVYQTESDISKSDILSALTSGNAESIGSIPEGDFSVKVYEAKSNGIVSGLDLEEGGVFQKGQTLFKVSPEKSFQIQINAVEKDIPKIKIGQKVEIDCKAIENTLHGEISAIAKSAKQTTTAVGKETTVKVTVKIDEEDDKIKSGYTAVCTVTVNEKENTLLVPYSSVLTDSLGKTFVYAQSGSKVEKRYVVCGFEYNNGLEITDGLSPGEPVLIDASKVSSPKNAVVNEVGENAE